MSDPTPIADLVGFGQRVAEWRENQPWKRLLEAPEGSPDWLEGRRLLTEARESLDAQGMAAHKGLMAESLRLQAEATQKATVERACVPERVRESVLDPRPTRACQLVHEWLGGSQWCRVLSGGVGVGKTVAACIAAVAMRGRYVTARETSDRLFDRQWWHDLERERLVAIDDLGVETRDKEGYWLDRFWAFLDVRYRDKAPLLLTTNLAYPAFEARFLEGDGGRTKDRLRGEAMFSHVEGESLR